MAIEIVEVSSEKQLKEFIRFQITLYENCPHFVPPIIRDEFITLSKNHNPSFEVCDTKLWLAYKDGVLSGRIAGIIHKPYIEKWGNRYARFGWFDVIDDENVSNALFTTVENWAVENGMEALHGPLGFTDFDPEGILIDGFEELATITERYNHSYYQNFIELAGFHKDADWVEYEVIAPKSIPEKVKRVAQKVLDRYHLKVVKINSVRELLPYSKGIFRIINDIYGLMYGFTPITEKQIEFYIGKYIKYLTPDLISIITNSDNQVVAFGITMPSYSKALQKIGGKYYPFGQCTINKAKKSNDTLDMYFIGVHPEYQNKGLVAVIFNDMLGRVLNKGFVKAETNIEFESNDKVRSLWDFFEHRQHKRRRSYFKYLVQKSRSEDAKLI